MARCGLRRRPARPPSQTWQNFLRTHASAIWAAGLSTVQRLTFTTLYVLVLIRHGRREIVHLDVTAHPAAAWIWRRPVEDAAWDRRLRFLLLDQDAVSGGDFAARARQLGIQTLLALVRAPRVNAISERVKVAGVAM